MSNDNFISRVRERNKKVVVVTHNWKFVKGLIVFSLEKDRTVVPVIITMVSLVDVLQIFYLIFFFV